MGAGYEAAGKFNDLRYRAGDESVEVGSKIAALMFNNSRKDHEFYVPKVMYGRVIAIVSSKGNEQVYYITQDERVLWAYFPQTCVAHHEIY